MKRSRRKRKRIVLRRFLIIGGVLGLVIFLGFWGYKGFQKWQAQRFIRRAETYVSWGDTKSATLAARHVLELDPKNAAALRILAELTEKAGLSAAIDWRRKIVDNDPASVADAVALAKTALKFNALGTAETALERIARRGEANAGYHETLGQIALARKLPNEAALHFQEALKIEPDNPVVQLELAKVQLRSNDPGARDDSKKLLEKLLNDKLVRVAAVKTLLEDAAEQKDRAVIRFAELLHSFPEAPFSDRLICLQIFARLELPQFAPALTDLQEEAQKAPDKLAALIAWMSTNNLSIVGLEWSKRLPEGILIKRPVFVALSDCYVTTKDFAGLQQWCSKSKWGDLEFLRHAYLSWGLRGSNDAINADLEWSKALKEASAIDDIKTLQRAAAKWGWKKESIDLLWTLANNSDEQRSALDALYQHYGEQGDTGNLYRVAARLSRIAPDDLEIQNNFAQLSLLLKVDMERARTLARQLYDGHKTNANLVSTYAYALYTQGRANEAANIMTALGPDELRRPEIAAYYAVILSATGARKNAREFFEIGETARLLPEERRLVQDAIARQ